MANKVRINFELSEDLFNALKNAATKQELTYSALLRLIIKDYLVRIDIDENGKITGLF